MIKPLKLPKKLLFLVNEKKRFKVAYGGRGSAKSWSYARALIVKAVEKKIRVLCTRKLQTSIANSVHKLLTDSIFDLGLSAYFRITKDSITGINGSEFFFKGLQNNINEIKSIEGIDYCWCEEAQDISNELWKVLIPTIRKEGSEIWITFNPDREEDATYQLFVIQKRPDCIAVKINYDENPWFPDVLRSEMEYCRSVNVADYEHIWLGKTRVNTDAQIFKDRYEIADFESPENIRFFHGADWGFAKDPTTLVRCFILNDCLYVDQEAYGVGVDRIYRQIQGWDTINNPAAGVLGTNKESRIEYENRRKNSLALYATGSREAVYSRVFNVTNVTDVIVVENDSSESVTIQGVELVRNSIYVIANGGDNTEIAEAIRNSKSGGCATNGEVSVLLPKTYVPIQFSRPQNINVYAQVTLDVDENTPENFEELIQNAIIANFNGSDDSSGITIGQTIYASRFYCPLTALGLNIVSIKISKDNSTWRDALSFNLNQLPVTDAANITVLQNG